MAQTAKTIELMMEKAIDTHEQEDILLPLITSVEPDGAVMQNAGNVIIRPVPQHRPLISGWDTSGQATDIITEAYLASLGTPVNDRIDQRADQLRDTQYWIDAAGESGRKQSTAVNVAIANEMRAKAALYYRSNDTSGYDFVSEAGALMRERQGALSEKCFLFNTRDSVLFGSDLAARQNINGRAEKAWEKGRIGEGSVAGFKLYDGTFLPNLTGGADPATTVTGNHSFAPRAGTVVTDNIVTNYDYREAAFVVADSSGYTVNDKVTIANAGVTIKALGKMDKTNTGEAMTFTITAITDATHVTLWPRPIAADDAALTLLEKAYANVDTTALNAATLNRINTDATQKTNLFWDKSAVEIIRGNIPAQFFAKFEGMKVRQEKMKNGLTMYFLYGGDMDSLTFKFRLFTWYGLTVAKPDQVGVAVTFT